MALPKIAVFQEAEDFENLETDVSVLFDKFVKPIDLLRSSSVPIPSGKNQTNTDDFQNLQVSNTEIFESRCHAFYRMLGLPVVSGNAFYNPGFNPNNTSQDRIKKIKTGFFQNHPDIYNLMQQRERLVIANKNIFAKQNLTSSIYALLLRYIPPFNLLQSAELLEVEKQKFTISDRSDELKQLADANISLKTEISEAALKTESGQKIIKPFIVDPKIESTVMPDLKQICVPFLPTKESTQIDGKNFLQRPGLELIIRQRLTNAVEDTLFLSQVEDIIKENKNPGKNVNNMQLATLVDSLQALSDDNEITNKTKDSLKGTSSFQLLMINQLTKTIKILIKELIDSITIIDKAKFELNWFPVPSIDGPVTGIIGAKLGSFGLKNNQVSSLEHKIIELKIKKLNAERHNNSLDDFGFFASPFNSNAVLDSVETYQNQINELVQKKNQISDEAFKALSNIEKIVGEIAGFGLIDVLCIYLTFWSLDLKTLIHFMDEDSFARLYDNNPSYRAVKEVSDRKISGSSVEITNVLKIFEGRLFNVLSFADKTFQNYLSFGPI